MLIVDIHLLAIIHVLYVVYQTAFAPPPPPSFRDEQTMSTTTRRARRVVVPVSDEGTAAATAAQRNASDVDASSYVPPQERFISGVDHRGITKTTSHGKRKRDADDGGENADATMMMEEDYGEAFRNFKAAKATYDANAGKKSGRPWKMRASRASSLGAVGSNKTWEARMEEKARKKRFQEAVKTAKAERGAKIRAERERRERVKEIKEENRRRTGVGIAQQITNPKTIAKKSAKERAKLKKLRML